MTCEASEEETFYGSTMGRRRGLVHISCELFLACVFVSFRDAPTLAITTTDLKPSGYPLQNIEKREIRELRMSQV